MIKDNIFTKNKIIKNKDIMKGICDFISGIYKDGF